MGGETLGPVKALCPSIGDCQGQEWELGGLGSTGSHGLLKTLSLFFSSLRTASKGVPVHTDLDLSCQGTVWGDSLESQS